MILLLNFYYNFNFRANYLLFKKMSPNLIMINSIINQLKNYLIFKAHSTQLLIVF